MMTKWVITTVELVKRVNIVDAYTKIDAYDKLCDLGSERDVQAVEVEVIGDHIIHEESISEYDYNKDWKPKLQQFRRYPPVDYHLQGPEGIDVSAGDDLD